MQRPDRRRERTRRQLSEALIALILERGYDAIRIEDITERANLGRATFYLHFTDKQELLLTTLQRVVDELIAQIHDLPPGQLTPGVTTPALIAFRHADANKALYRVMLQSQVSGVVVGRLRNYLAERVHEQMTTALSTLDIQDKGLLPLDVVSNYVASSLLGLINWWVERETDYDAEQMAAMFQQMNVAALNAALNDISLT
ncbi:MAG: TetR/AcrR family transcriptional regulator [Anaerolineae bacterium]|nr:TetR/AcrR family transcriptional regulator [Anaerolineae bacterium]